MTTDGRTNPRELDWRDALLLLVCFGIITAAWYPALSGVSTLLGLHDAIEQTWPWWRFNVAEVQAGRLPLWNPYSNGGVPHLGEGQAFGLYPPALLVAWLGGRWAETTATLHLMGVAHAWLACAGAFLTARSLRLPALAAAASGLVFALGGYFSMRANNQLNIFWATAWVPFIVWGAIRTIQRSDVRWMLASGAAVASSIYAGHGQPAYHGVVATCGVLVGAAILRLPQERPLTAAKAGAAILVLAISSLTLSAAQLGPMAEYQARALRWVGLDEPMVASTKLPYDVMAINASMRVHQFSSVVNPEAQPPDDGSIYLGFTGAALVIAGLWGRTRWRWIWGALAAIGVLIALGDQTPALRIAAWLPLNQTRAPVRWLLLTHLAASVLAGMGVAWLAARLARWHPRLGVIGGLAAVALVGAELGPQVSRDWPAVAAGHTDARNLPEYTDPAVTNLIDFARARPGTFRMHLWEATGVAENVTQLMRVPSTSGFAATRPLKLHRFQSHAPSHASDVLGIGLLATTSSEALPRWFERFVPVRNFGPIRVFENPSARPIAWLVDEVKVVGSDEEALTAIAADLDITHVAVVTASAPGTSRPDAGARGTVALRDYRPGYVRLDVTSIGRALLVTSEPDYPGWQATIDGTTTPAVNVNYAFRGVMVPDGTHTVEFKYRPWTVYGGLTIVAIGCLGVLGVVALGRRSSARGLGAL